MNHLFLFEEYELQKDTKEDFIKKARKIYEDDYDYSKVNYINSKNPVEIICNKHNTSFLVSPNHFLSKRTICPKCTGRIPFYNTQEFIDSAKRIYGDDYDYSKINYTNTRNKIEVTCKKHNKTFSVNARKFLLGSGCPICSGRYDTDEFIHKSREINGDKYDYSKVNYINSRTPVEIICKKHNKSFFPTPKNFINNKTGCPFCIESKGESILNMILRKYAYNFEKQKKFQKIGQLRFDFYVDAPIKTCIEYDGEQHYKPIFWGSKSDNIESAQNRFEQVKKYDEIKNQYCKDHNIQLIRVPYTKKTMEDIEDYLIEVGFLTNNS